MNIFMTVMKVGILEHITMDLNTIMVAKLPRNTSNVIGDCSQIQKTSLLLFNQLKNDNSFKISIFRLFHFKNIIKLKF